MAKQPDTHRAVTESDLQVVEGAIAYSETLLRHLYTLRRVLGEVGSLDQRLHGLKEGIAVVERQGEQVNAELEAANTRLATVQREEVEARQRVATLTAAAAEKERELSAYSTAIDKIVGKAA